jgi:hypothetical protein
MVMYELEDPGSLTAPALLVAFEGWVSAGAAGTATIDHLAGDAPVIATFDGDQLFDYRANRPTADYFEGVLTDLTFPEIALRRRTLGDRDLLLLSGTEPNWNWKTFGGQIADLAGQLGVIEHVSLGGIPWATPHTRPTSIVETASAPEQLGSDADHPEGRLRVPAAAVSIIEKAMIDRGLPTFGFWARVPHYVGTTYAPAVVALVERVSTHLGVVAPLGSLLDEAAEQRRVLDDLIEDQPQARAIVEQLEALVDQEGNVSGVELAAEIEKFLADTTPDDGFAGREPG